MKSTLRGFITNTHRDSILLRVAEQVKAEQGEAVRKRVVWLEAEREAMRSQVQRAAIGSIGRRLEVDRAAIDRIGRRLAAERAAVCRIWRLLAVDRAAVCRICLICMMPNDANARRLSEGRTRGDAFSGLALLLMYYS
jgi:hypothetical protein